MRRNMRGRNAPVRSVRISDEVWEKVKHRADADGVTPSYVLGSFIEAYAEGIIDLPTVVLIYSGTEKTSENDESKETE